MHDKFVGRLTHILLLSSLLEMDIKNCDSYRIALY